MIKVTRRVLFHKQFFLPQIKIYTNTLSSIFVITFGIFTKIYWCFYDDKALIRKFTHINCSFSLLHMIVDMVKNNFLQLVDVMVTTISVHLRIIMKRIKFVSGVILMRTKLIFRVLVVSPNHLIGHITTIVTDSTWK